MGHFSGESIDTQALQHLGPTLLLLTAFKKTSRGAEDKFIVFILISMLVAALQEKGSDIQAEVPSYILWTGSSRQKVEGNLEQFIPPCLVTSTLKDCPQ